MPAAEPLRLVVGEGEEGRRLDSALAALAGVSRSEAQRWIEEGRVRAGGRPVRASQRVRAGDALEADPLEPLPSPLAPEAIPVPLLFEDADVVVVDKPAGLVVHPAPGHAGGTLVNALLYHCGDLAGVGGVRRPGIVHRLDRGTSGVMVVAKTDAAHRSLAVQFHDHSVEREYRALVRGLPRADAGRSDRPIGRHPRDRKRMSVRTDRAEEGYTRAREAHTGWRVLRRFPVSDRAWLAVQPETGRTHQIRVHLAAAGLPLVGDPVYGGARGRVRNTAARGRVRSLDRPALHAAVLGFTHPRTGARLRFEAPLPDDLADLLAALERREGSPGPEAGGAGC